MKISFLKKLSLAAVFCLAFFFAGCAAAPCCKNSQESQKTQDFSVVKERVWQLVQARDSAGSVTFDGSRLDMTKFGDIYTLQFSDTLASGKAAPNRYTAPYALGKGDAISFKPAASTMMFGIHTPEGLSETEFFKLLDKIYRWSFEKEMLSLYASDGSTLIFKEFDYRK